MSERSCINCLHCKTKNGILAYCSKDHWGKEDGSPKYIMASYLPDSVQAKKVAEYCKDYEDMSDEDM
ncbi:MAG: hypothetical protein V3V07_04675 [candidate division NC10 bacterium]|jgi:hypothetical protein|nr:hypothetical protein [Deltaproteobacteria bacterium]